MTWTTQPISTDTLITHILDHPFTHHMGHHHTFHIADTHHCILHHMLEPTGALLLVDMLLSEAKT
jgi:hypothetical protein